MHGTGTQLYMPAASFFMSAIVDGLVASLYIVIIYVFVLRCLRTDAMKAQQTTFQRSHHQLTLTA
jgi:hypothetical protein